MPGKKPKNLLKKLELLKSKKMTKGKIESTGKHVGGVLVGLVAANTVITAMPGKKIVPMATVAIGTGIAVTQKNGFVQTAGAAMAAFGVVATVNQMGVGQNPMVRKFIPQLAPAASLGSLAEISMDDYDYEPVDGLYGDDAESMLLGIGEVEDDLDDYDYVEGLDGETEIAESLLGL